MKIYTSVCGERSLTGNALTVLIRWNLDGTDGQGGQYKGTDVGQNHRWSYLDHLMGSLPCVDLRVIHQGACYRRRYKSVVCLLSKTVLARLVHRDEICGLCRRPCLSSSFLLCSFGYGDGSSIRETTRNLRDMILSNVNRPLVPRNTSTDSDIQSGTERTRYRSHWSRTYVELAAIILNQPPCCGSPRQAFPPEPRVIRPTKDMMRWTVRQWVSSCLELTSRESVAQWSLK